MISLEQGVDLVWTAFNEMFGGEIFVKKIPSMSIVDIANAVAPNIPQITIGIRPGEKIHEQMIGFEDAPYTYEFKDYFKILPQINGWDKNKKTIKNGKKVRKNFTYSSDNNSEWMTKKKFKNWLNLNQKQISKT